MRSRTTPRPPGPRPGRRTLLTGIPLLGAGALAMAGCAPDDAGAATDVEVDEVFVVLSGSATVSFDDGERVDLGPGTVVRLRSGEHTTWVVHETLRKIYVA